MYFKIATLLMCFLYSFFTKIFSHVIGPQTVDRINCFCLNFVCSSILSCQHTCFDYVYLHVLLWFKIVSTFIIMMSILTTWMSCLFAYLSILFKICTHMCCLIIPFLTDLSKPNSAYSNYHLSTVCMCVSIQPCTGQSFNAYSSYVAHVCTYIPICAYQIFGIYAQFGYFCI